MPTRHIPTLLACITLAGAASFAEAADPASSPADVATLMTRDLGGIPGKEGLMLTVEYPPGGSSPPHRHDANVFVYVLEGSVIMQVEGKDAVTLRAGDTFYESPTDVHLKSANASQTAPAKILVVMVKDKGKPASRPATAHH
jgi:quercetin dioxygenase-like cupin family protein